ncbi:hypothetical protein M501DRAFT_990233 [Patellaria atrata CBS 101060]|uniref:Uncharacterized protein n=1 Tax=Patellaria atrata CBS 101060 TaxID=1346257 RepID=A0A9P4S3F2_9PEZI|nr:hypothetical protein M501DRAFT_990233 [Patellaria atrata CBS 101060]
MELDRLQRRVVEKTYPREWHVLKLEATASYEKMRVSDTQTFEVESSPDLEELMGLLKLWRSNWPNRALTLDSVLHVEEIEDSRSEPEPGPKPQPQSGRSKTPRKSATQQQLASTVEYLPGL